MITITHKKAKDCQYYSYFIAAGMA